MNIYNNESREVIKSIIRDNDLNRLKEYDHNVHYMSLKNYNIENIFDILIYAIEFNASIELIEYLLENVPYETLDYSIVENDQIKSPLCVALGRNRFKLIKILVEKYSIDMEKECSVLFKQLMENNNLNEKNLRYISQYGIPSNMKDIISVVLENPKNCIEPIFKRYIYDNAFILDLLDYSKKKKTLSKQELKEKIQKEKSKISIIESNYVQAMKSHHDKNLKCLYDYDSTSSEMIIEDRILHYDLLGVSVRLNDIEMLKQILKYPIYQFQNLASDKLMKEANNNMDILKLLIQAQLKLIPKKSHNDSTSSSSSSSQKKRNESISSDTGDSYKIETFNFNENFKNDFNFKFSDKGSVPFGLNLKMEFGSSKPTFGSYRKVPRRKHSNKTLNNNNSGSNNAGFVFNQNLVNKKKFTFGGGEVFTFSKESSCDSLQSQSKENEPKTVNSNNSNESLTSATGFTFGSFDRICEYVSPPNIETIKESNESLQDTESKEPKKSISGDETKSGITSSIKKVLFSECKSPSNDSLCDQTKDSNSSIDNQTQNSSNTSLTNQTQESKPPLPIKNRTQTSENINLKRSGSSRESVLYEPFSCKKIYEIRKPEKHKYDSRYLLTIVNKVIRLGNLELVSYLYTSGEFPSFDINSCDLKGECPIVVTIQNHRQEIFEYIMRNSLIMKKPNDKSYLYLAIQHQQSRIVRSLLENAIFNAMDKDPQKPYPLFLAIEKNNYEIVHYLVLNCRNLNLDMNILDDHGNTPLTLAYRRGYHLIFDYLLRYLDINQRDSSKQTILSYAINRNDTDTVEELLGLGAEVNEVIDKEGYSLLDLAITKGNKDIILNILLYYPYKPNIKDSNNNNNNNKDNKNNQQEPLNSEENKKPLIIRVIQMNNCKEGDKIDILQYLIDQGHDVNELYDLDSYSPLTYAIERRSLAMVKLLIQNGADIQFKYYMGYTRNRGQSKCKIKRNLLILAMELDEVEIFKYLIDSGLDASPIENMENMEKIDNNSIIINEDYTVWRYALEYCNNPDIIEYLASTNIKYLKFSDIFYTKERFEKLNENKIFEILVKYGMDINMKDENGNSILVKTMSMYNNINYDYLMDVNACVLNVNKSEYSILQSISKEILKRKKRNELN